MEKVIVVTGASEGLGKETARQLGKQNKVIIVSHDEKKLKNTANELNCDYMVCDVTDYELVQKTIAQIIDNYEKIDVLINNSGVWLAGDLEENSYEEISHCIDVNTKGHIYMTKAVIPNMVEHSGGLIINVCSQASFDTDPGCSVYTASKWALRGFNRVLQRDLSKKNIRVTGFYPGFMKTNIFKKANCDYDMSTALEVEKVANAIGFIVNTDSDVIIPEFGVKDIENY